MGLEQSKHTGRGSYHRGYKDVDPTVGKYGNRSSASRHRYNEYIPYGSPTGKQHVKRRRSLEDDIEYYIHVHFFTYGAAKGRPAIELPVLSAIDLSQATPPPESLCRRFTGRDLEIIEDFWSHPVHHRLYHDMVRDIGYKLIGLLRSGRKAHVAVLVNCASGVCISVSIFPP